MPGVRIRHYMRVLAFSMMTRGGKPLGTMESHENETKAVERSDEHAEKYTPVRVCGAGDM